MLLIFFAAIPGGILTFSCTYMCGCSRFVFVGEDGHMRLHCCGKAVTGIGKIVDNLSMISLLTQTMVGGSGRIEFRFCCFLGLGHSLVCIKIH